MGRQMAAYMPEADVLQPKPEPQADVYDALRRQRLNQPRKYVVEPPAGGWMWPQFISDGMILDQSDVDTGKDLGVPSYFPKILP